MLKSPSWKIAAKYSLFASTTQTMKFTKKSYNKKFFIMTLYILSLSLRPYDEPYRSKQNVTNKCSFLSHVLTLNNR